MKLNPQKIDSINLRDVIKDSEKMTDLESDEEEEEEEVYLNLVLDEKYDIHDSKFDNDSTQKIVDDEKHIRTTHVGERWVKELKDDKGVEHQRFKEIHPYESSLRKFCFLTNWRIVKI